MPSARTSTRTDRRSNPQGDDGVAGAGERVSSMSYFFLFTLYGEMGVAHAPPAVVWREVL